MSSCISFRNSTFLLKYDIFLKLNEYYSNCKPIAAHSKKVRRHKYVCQQPHQVIHASFASRVDVLQEFQQVEGVAVHQVDSYGQVWLMLEIIQQK